MTLTIQNQLKFLHDILEEQIIDKTASVNDYQQIKKLVQSIMCSNSINNEQLFQILPEIYYYGIQGENVQCLQEHIKSNEENIKQWKTTLIKTEIAE